MAFAKALCHPSSPFSLPFPAALQGPFEAQPVSGCQNNRCRLTPPRPKSVEVWRCTAVVPVRIDSLVWGAADHLLLVRVLHSAVMTTYGTGMCYELHRAGNR